MGGGTCFSQLDKAAADAFVRRIVGERFSSAFVVEYIPAAGGKDVFEVESRRGKIVLRGNNGLSVGSALNYYLRSYCHSFISWDGVDLRLPAVLPVVGARVRRETPYRYRYYLNYCTFNYSMAWWDWDRWQREIDWMTLNGVNMPLAITGEEAICQKVYRELGFTDTELAKFFSGPAYFAWFWMGNLDGWGGPLPQHWIDTHLVLEKKILAAERAMGMKPVLAAFTGHVPAAFVRRFPTARVKKTNWGAGFDDVYILDPADSLFEVIGRRFIEAQTREYGTDHLYSADTFNENQPPSNDPGYLGAISKKVYASMADADPRAVWVMQGWLFHYAASFWGNTQIKALLNAVPDDHMIMLDLYSESHPVWDRTEASGAAGSGSSTGASPRPGAAPVAYYGKPWIWNMLNNFGGNTFLWGRMEAVATGPAEALHSPESGRFSGIGLTPEGIEENPALYQLMLDNIWQDRAISLPAWLSSYVLSRYGVLNADALAAWRILAGSVYAGGFGEGGPESIIVARPTTEVWADRVRTRLDYEPRDLVRAWGLMVRAADSLGSGDGFRYDLVDVTRQVLANYAMPLQQRWVLAYLSHDFAAFDSCTAQFLGLMDDLDVLLATRREFLLGRWIGDARRCAASAAEADLYEKNARDLITLWGDKESGLHEYACRQWSGLIKDFYKPRWERYFGYLRQKMERGDRMEETSFDEAIRDWEWKWVNTTGGGYPEQPVGDVLTVVRRLYTKYATLVR